MNSKSHLIVKKNKKIWYFQSSIFAVLFLNALSVKASDLVLKGSSTIFPICKAASKQYFLSNKKIIICEGGGSNVGIKFALEGGIATVSRSLTVEEKSKGLQEVSIGRDALAFLVSSDNPLKNITDAQLTEVFSGQIKNWSKIAPSYNKEIMLIGPNSDHGTFDSLLSFLHLSNIAKDQNDKNVLEKNYQGNLSHNETIFKAEQNSNAISAVPLGFWITYLKAKNNRLKALNINGIAPEAGNILSKKYPFARVLHIVWKGELSKNAKEFVDFLLSSRGRQIVKEQGFSVEDRPAE